MSNNLFNAMHSLNRNTIDYCRLFLMCYEYLDDEHTEDDIWEYVHIDFDKMQRLSNRHYAELIALHRVCVQNYLIDPYGNVNELISAILDRQIELKIENIDKGS